MLPTVIIGVSSALVFGAADFLGGLAAKRISPVLATAVAAATGLVVLLIVLPLPFFQGVWSAEAVWLGALSGGEPARSRSCCCINASRSGR